MDKKIAGLLGAVAGLATIGAAQAAPVPSPSATAESYADLLAPVPNAVAALKADDVVRGEQEKKGSVELAQYYYNYGPYDYGRPYYYHHHHHHHHHHHRGVFFGPGGIWIR